MTDTAVRPAASGDDDAATTPPPRSAEPVSATGAVSTAPPVLDTERLGRLLLGRWADIRLATRALVAKPEFQQIPGLGIEEHRARVLEQMHAMVREGAVARAFPQEYGGHDDHGGTLASFEEMFLADPSLQIKSGVQYGLFGSAIQHLGTKKHHDRWLADALTLKLPGVFAMTETGHGSDVASVGTTASYDPETETFVIDTPFRGAWKDYLGNAAKDGLAAVVFAQLITQGVNHGVHAFFVPIRDENGEFLPGVGGEDDGLKGGLVGVDNGRLHFSGVRIPRDNLLNRYGDVAPDGTYSSPIDSPGRRFFTMLGNLVQGRVSLNGAAAVAMKASLSVALIYGSQRRQFSDGGGEETVLLDYGRHQRRLIPLLAETLAVQLSHEQLLRMFDEVFSGANDTPQTREDLETYAAALKALSTWAAMRTLQETREACGGQGFLAENRITEWKRDFDVYVTFEGDNNVLLQLVGKRLLSDYAAQFKGADAARLARYAIGQVGDRIVSTAGLRKLAQNLVDLGSTARAVEHLREEEQRQLLTDRVQTMVAGIAARLNAARKEGAAAAAAAFNETQNELIEAARAHGELLQWEAFTNALAEVEDEGTRTVLTWFRDIFGLGLLEKHLAWYLVNGRLSAQRAEAATRYLDRLIARVRPYALAVVESFGYDPIAHLRAPIASGAEAERQDEARAYYAQLRASGRAPVDEKTLKKAARQR